jgi:hypothetical protein
MIHLLDTQVFDLLIFRLNSVSCLDYFSDDIQEIAVGDLRDTRIQEIDLTLLPDGVYIDFDDEVTQK